MPNLYHVHLCRVVKLEITPSSQEYKKRFLSLIYVDIMSTTCMTSFQARDNSSILLCATATVPLTTNFPIPWRPSSSSIICDQRTLNHGSVTQRIIHYFQDYWCHEHKIQFLYLLWLRKGAQEIHKYTTLVLVFWGVGRKNTKAANLYNVFDMFLHYQQRTCLSRVS